MTAIYLDESGINNYVKNGLSSSVQSIKSAVNYSSQLNIPTNFAYKNYLESLYSYLNNNYSTAKNVYDKIVSATTGLKKMNDKMSSNLSAISNYKINRRTSAIS